MANLVLRNFLFGVSAALLLSCSNDGIPIEEMRSYVLDPANGLKKTWQNGDTRIDVIYQPTDLMISRELQKGVVPDSSRIGELRRKYAPNHYFLMSLTKNGRELLHQLGPNEYGDMVRILSFEMDDYVFLTNSTDTLHLRDFILDRTYNIAPATNILFAFEKEGLPCPGGNLRFWLTEFGLGIGLTEVDFDREDICLIPKVVW